jgi:hypothetical protein
MLDTGFDSTSGFTAYFRGSALLPGCRIRSSRSKFLFSTDLSLEASMLDSASAIGMNQDVSLRLVR